MSVIFDQGSKPSKIPLLPLPPKPHYFLCMFPYDFLIYVNFKFDLLDSMDLKRHTLICIFSCSCRWLGERSEASKFWKGIQTITIITPLQEQLDRLKPQTLQINQKNTHCHCRCLRIIIYLIYSFYFFTMYKSYA